LREQLTKEGFCVYLPFLPGFGKTSPPKKPWSVSDFSEFVLKFAQKQNLKKFFLLGHSFGGRIAIKLTANHPGKVLGLILCSSAGLKPKRGVKYWFFFFLAKIGNLFFSIFPLNLVRPTARRLLYFFVQEQDYYQAKGVMREIVKKVIEEDLTFHLKRIQVPTLIVWGEEDRITPVADAYLMASKIPNSKLVILKEAGHGLPFGKPAKLTQLVREFCRRIYP